MGFEVVYCYKCQTRLTESDFRQGNAFRVGIHTTCATCADDLLRNLTPEQQAAVLNPPRPGPPAEDPSKASPRPPAAPRREAIGEASPHAPGSPRRVLIIAASLLVLAALVLLIASSGGPAPAPAGEGTTTSSRYVRPSVDLPVLPNSAPPSDAAPPASRMAPKAAGTDADLRVPDALKERVAASAALEESVRAAAGRDDYKAALASLEEGRKRYTDMDWARSIDTKVADVKSRAREALMRLTAEASQARSKGNAAEVERIRGLVRNWDLDGFLPELEKALAQAPVEASSRPVPPTPPTPPPLTGPTPESLRAAWDAALFRAGGRDYAGAWEALGKDALAADSCAAEVALLKKAEKLTQEALQALATWPVGKEIELAYRSESGEVRRVKGPLVKREPFHLEIKEKDTVHGVHTGEITGAGMAGLLLRLSRAGTTAESRQALGVLCLVEGDVMGADSMLKKGDPPIPERFRAFAREAPADRARREDEARKLFARAESERVSLGSAAGAVLRYRALLKDHAGTQVVMRNKALLVQRAEGARECFYSSDDMAGSGSFQPVTRPDGESPWESKADTDPARRKENYVELSFSLLPETTYRCWAYVGGCCAETLAFHVQATGLTGAHPETKETVPMEPGGANAAPVEQRLVTVPRKHSEHGGAKRPSRWGWVPLPLPAGADAGPRRLRILTSQQGFAVSCVLLSALRESPPSDLDRKRLVSERMAALEAEGLTRLRNLDPALVIYLPFDEGKGATAFNAARGHERASLEGGPAWAGGKSGKALRFDGSGAHVRLPASPSTREAERDLTLAAWVFVEDGGGNKCVLSRSLEEYAYGLFVNGTTLEMWVAVDGTNRIWLKGGSVPVGQWAHVACTVTGSGIRLYINGGTPTAFGGPLPRTPRDGAVFAGADCFGGKPGNPFKGSIDDVRVYGRALPDAEVSALANPRSP